MSAVQIKVPSLQGIFTWVPSAAVMAACAGQTQNTCWLSPAQSGPTGSLAFVTVLPLPESQQGTPPYVAMARTWQFPPAQAASVAFFSSDLFPTDNVSFPMSSFLGSTSLDFPVNPGELAMQSITK